MKRSMTEQRALKKLGVEDFRHVPKDKIILMATMLDKMDPEVAKKALEQFPDFASTMKSIFSEYKDFLEKGLADNNASVKSNYETLDAIIWSCQKELDKEELSFDERKVILDNMVTVARMKKEIDADNKRFIIAKDALIVSAFSLSTCAMLSLLGGKASINLNSLRKI